MKRTLVSQLADSIGRTVKIAGWVQTIRDQKRMQFLVIRDHTGSVQVVLEKARHPVLAETITGLARESAVRITGEVAENAQVGLGGIEIYLSDLEVVGSAASPLPIDLFGEGASGPGARLDWRYLDLRRPERRLIFEVQTTAEAAMRSFWRKEGFVEVHTPKLMGSASESGAELFELDYFGGRAYLAQSPQFYKQMAMAAGFDRVFEIGPVFRANPSFTSRHDTEFTSVDVEISWIESHEDVMALEERWLHHVIRAVAEEHGEAIASRYGREVEVPSLPFPRMPLAEIVEALSDEGYAPPAGKEGDLDSRGERLAGEYIRKEYAHDFVFVTDYPASIRPFYHMRYAERPETTKSFDLLWRGLELTTGAQREHRYDVLVEQAREKGLGIESMQYYLDFFRYGCPPHGGYGFGLTRMLMILLGLPSVREATFLYRGPKRISP